MSLQMILLLWMFSGLTFGTRQSIGVFFPEKHHLSCSQFFSVVYNTFCRTEDSMGFPHPVWHICWYCPCSVQVCAIISVRLYICSFWNYKDIQSYIKLPHPLSLILVQYLLHQCSLNVRSWMFCSYLHLDWASKHCIFIVQCFLLSFPSASKRTFVD